MVVFETKSSMRFHVPVTALSAATEFPKVSAHPRPYSYYPQQIIHGSRNTHPPSTPCYLPTAPTGVVALKPPAWPRRYRPKNGANPKLPAATALDRDF